MGFLSLRRTIGVVLMAAGVAAALAIHFLHHPLITIASTPLPPSVGPGYQSQVTDVTVSYDGFVLLPLGFVVIAALLCILIPAPRAQ
jgi:hypothetical protein